MRVVRGVGAPLASRLWCVALLSASPLVAQEDGITLGKVIVNTGSDSSSLSNASQFSRLTPDGGVLVADHVTQMLYHYALDGTLRWRAGQRGEGPGEFRSLANFGADADRVIALDRSLRRTTIFSLKSGKLMETRPFPTPPPTLVAPVLWAETGACSAWLAKEPQTTYFGLAIVSDKGKLHRFSLGGAATQAVTIHHQGQDRNFFPPYMVVPPAALDVVRGDLALVSKPQITARSVRFELTRLDACGGPTFPARTFEFPAILFPAGERERHVKQWNEAGERFGIPASEMRAAITKGLQLPPAYPPILYATLATDGRLIGRRTGESVEPISSVARRWVLIPPVGGPIVEFVTRRSMTVLDVVGKDVLIRDLPNGWGGAEVIRLARLP